MRSFVLAAILFFEIPTLFAQPDTLWTRRFGGNLTDEARAVKQTADGGFVLAGYTDSYGNGGSDFLLIRTSPNGDSLWTRTFGGPSTDRCNSLTIASDGGFVLAGLTETFGAGASDIWVVRTNEFGDSLWSVTLGGQSVDIGVDVVAAADGTIYVAGTTDSYGAPGSDFWLIALSDFGDSLWSETYGDEQPHTCKALDDFPDGRLVIAGIRERGEWADMKSLILSSEGEILDSHSSGWGSTRSLCYDVVVLDAQKYVMAGHYWEYDDLDGTGEVALVPGVGPQWDWRRFYGGGGYDVFSAVTGDYDSRMVCAGYTESYDAGVNFPDFWLVQLDPAGDSLWLQTFDLGGSESAYDVQTLNAGYVLVGTCEDSFSQEQDVWLVRAGYVGPYLDIYPTSLEFGHVSVMDTLRQFVMLRNLGTSALELTGIQLPVSFSSDLQVGTSLEPGDSLHLGVLFHPMVLGPVDGVVTIQGTMFNTPGFQVHGYGLVDSLWSQTYGGTGSDSCSVVLCMADGDFLLAGTTTSFGNGSADFWVIRVDSDGDTVWTRTYGGLENDVCRAANLTPDDGIVLAGTTESFAGETESCFWLVKISLEGDSLWSRTYGLGLSSACNSICAMQSGGFTLGGTVDSGEQLDIAILRIGNNGDSVWSAIYGNPGYDERCDYILEVPTETLLAIGSRYIPFDDERETGYMVSFDSDGNLLNQRAYNCGYGNDAFNHAMVMEDGNYLFTGSCDRNWVPNNGSDMWTVLTIPFGMWWSRRNYVQLHNQAWMSLRLPGHGLLTVGSTGSDLDGPADGAVVAYDLNGPTDWIRTYGGAEGDEIRTVTLGDSGAILLGGTTSSYGAGQSDMWLIKLAPTQLPDQSRNVSPLPAIWMLHQNYPNPFNSSTRISFDLPHEERIAIRIFNIMGQEVASLADDVMSAGVHSVQFEANELPSGIYFCNLQTATHSETRKMVLLK